MTDCIWYLQATSDPSTSRGFIPVGQPGEDIKAYFQRLSILAARIEKAEVIPIEELPTDYETKKTDPKRNLNLPMWHSSFVHVHKDMAAVLRRFDIGQTVMAPMRITMSDGVAVNTDYCLLAVTNLKMTVDPARSGPKAYGSKRWAAPHSSSKVNTTLVALRSTLEGPDIWTAPDVFSTIFVSDRLAQALLAEEWGSKLKLRKVLVAMAEGA